MTDDRDREHIDVPDEPGFHKNEPGDDIRDEPPSFGFALVHPDLEDQARAAAQADILDLDEAPEEDQADRAR